MKTSRKPTLFQAIIPIVVLMLLIMVNVTIIKGEDSLAGPNQMALLLSSAVAGVIAYMNGVKWKKMLGSIGEMLIGSIGAILILLMIGMLAGSWMISGIIPSMIYYGLDILAAKWFLPATVIITAIISVSTGSSWSTIATVGVALIGIGRILGFNEAVVAGAIISGAYFGDKISPLSDTTNLASATTGTPLETHIRYMMFTTVPTILITLLIFGAISLFSSPADVAYSVSDIKDSISSVYTVSLWTLLIPAAVIFLIIKKVPAPVTLVIGSLMGIVLALCIQGNLISSLVARTEGTNTFGVLLRSLYGSTEVVLDNPLISDLCSTGGMAGMMNTVWLIIMAMAFGGIMEAGGFLTCITSAIMSKVSSTGGLVSSTAASCLLFNMITGDQYLTIMIPGKLYSKAYASRGLAPQVLSRTIEDSGTVTSVLIPWNSCGATQAGVLGVATLAYLPFCFFCYLSPVMTCLYAWLGIRIEKAPSEAPADNQ